MALQLGARAFRASRRGHVRHITNIKLVSVDVLGADKQRALVGIVLGPSTGTTRHELDKLVARYDGPSRWVRGVIVARLRRRARASPFPICFVPSFSSLLKQGLCRFRLGAKLAPVFRQPPGTCRHQHRLAEPLQDATVPSPAARAPRSHAPAGSRPSPRFGAARGGARGAEEDAAALRP